MYLLFHKLCKIRQGRIIYGAECTCKGLEELKKHGWWDDAGGIGWELKRW
jgi:hypothetical protein